MTRHLDDRVSDLVDNRLGEADLAVVLSHLTGCRPCRDRVEAERLTKSRLSSLAGPEPSAALSASLMALGAGAAQRPAAMNPDARLDDGPAGSRRPPAAERSSARPAGRLGGLRRGRRSDRARALAVLAVSLGVAGASVLGGSVVSATVNESATPAANLVVARHVVTMGGVPMLNLLPAWRAIDATGSR